MFAFQIGAPVNSPPLRVYVAEGDSITANTAISYPYYPTASSPRVGLINLSVAGATLADAIARQAVVDQVLACNLTAPSFVFSAMIGGNGFGSAGSGLLAQQITDLGTYYAARKAAGFKVIACTWTPRTTPLFNAARAQVNTAIRTWVGTNIHAVADFAADPTIGPDSAAPDSGVFNPTYYSDGIHLTAAGQAIVSSIFWPVISAL